VVADADRLGDDLTRIMGANEKGHEIADNAFPRAVTAYWDHQAETFTKRPTTA
jgi:hypothetical protein